MAAWTAFFSQMFQLPQPPQAALCYSVLLHHLCKLDRHRAGEPLTPMLVFTIECIFEQIDGMDVQVRGGSFSFSHRNMSLSVLTRH